MFPDLASVLHIREALWRHKEMGAASIMVGAGFSRNATPNSTSVRLFPTWPQMARSLCEPLYGADENRLKAALQDANGISGFLSLAQEYQVAFGVSALNDRIRSLVPDTDYAPGDLHARLLRLPWADVFSTNWDTLLERTCRDVFNRNYDIVRTPAEIPFTVRPRIVKLHGSFPAHEPFVFTEEEYRSYPARFSPFVNLVQQSMMETIFCLLGFSGDDPNFLHWAGWVRDNLGAGAPKIFLVNWLDLSPHRRRMLEARNVVPVDLAALPEAVNWPGDLRHRYAAEWFITALELGKPHDSLRWPRPPDTSVPLPPHLISIPGNTAPLPRHEPDAPPMDVPNAEAPGRKPLDPTARLKSVQEMATVWAHNRKLYPGWLVAPGSIRDQLWRQTRTWLSELSHINSWPVQVQVQFLSEAAWRLQMALLPLGTDMEVPGYAVLDAIDPSRRTIDGQMPSHSQTWTEIMAGVDTLALTLARNARHSANKKNFDKALAFLSTRTSYSPEVNNAVVYEQCLWDLACGDLTKLQNRLQDWQPAANATLWRLRKAGLFAQVEDPERAFTLIESTLLEIRRSRRRDCDDLPSLSLESWTLFIATADWRLRSIRSAPQPAGFPAPFERWRALAIVACDAGSEYEDLKHKIDVNYQAPAPTSRRRAFDLDHVTSVTHLNFGPSESVIAAYQIILLSEITGIPPATANFRLFSDGLKAAVTVLHKDEPWLASQFVLRIKSDDLTDTIFSRARVAVLPLLVVAMSQAAAQQMIAFCLQKISPSSSRDRGYVDSLATAMEALSRIAVRLEQAQLTDLLKQTAGYYRSTLFRQQALQLATPLKNLLSRTLDALPQSDIELWLPEIFSLPLPNELGTFHFSQYWHDPIRAIPSWWNPVDPSGAQPRSPRWEGTISHLLSVAEGTDLTDRNVAILRLFYVHLWKLLTPDESARFAKTLWAPSHLAPGGWPKIEILRPNALLTLPEEHFGQARTALLSLIAHWSDLPQPNIDVSSRLAEIGHLFQQFAFHKIPIELSVQIQERIQHLIRLWATSNTRQSSEVELAFVESPPDVLEVLDGIAALLTELNIPQDLRDRVLEKVDSMDSPPFTGSRAFVLYAALVRDQPERKQKLIDRLRRALFSDQEDEARLAVRGLYTLLRAIEENALDVPVDDLVRELSLAIAARRIAILRPALELAYRIYTEGPKHLREVIQADITHGLSALLIEMDYARLAPSGDIPSIRAASVRLAVAMAAAGLGDDPAVKGWIAAAASDPLPEVRNVAARNRS